MESKHNGSTRRDQIIAATWQALNTLGPSKLTVRSIARLADVDPALIYHYFASKSELIHAAVSVPEELVRQLKEAGADCKSALAVLDEAIWRPWIVALLTSLADSKEMGWEEVGKLLELIAPGASRQKYLTILGLLTARFVYQIPDYSGPIAELSCCD